MKRAYFLAIALLTAGCATPPDEIKPANVGGGEYTALSCDALGAEYMRVSSRLEPLISAQSSARSADVAGVILIGLPVGSMTASDSNEDRVRSIADLKGRQEAIKAVRTSKGCA